MKKLLLIPAFMIFLIITLPVCFATELNLVYDANGNLVTGDGNYREYNSLNQLIRVRNGSTVGSPLLESFIHHPTEERILIKKVYNPNGSEKEKVIYLDENFVRVVNSTGTFDYTYIKHEGQLIAQEVNNVKHFIHGDHLGSSTVVTDSSGSVVENTTYSPFGEIVEGGEQTRFNYEGKEFDSVVGDTDFHFRKYKAEWALFLQPDTLIQNVYDPQLLNRYAFERNNPYKNTDPTGHFTGLEIAGAMALYILGRGLLGSISAIGEYKSGMGLQGVGKLAWEGFKKGVVIGTAEVAIVTGFTLLGQPSLGLGTAIFVGEDIIDKSWQIDISEEDEENDPSKQIMPDIKPDEADQSKGAPKTYCEYIPKNNDRGGSGGGITSENPGSWWGINAEVGDEWKGYKRIK